MPSKRWLLTTDTVGGVWTYSLDLARGLAALGTDIVLVTMGPAPTARQIDDLAAIPGVLPVITDLPLDWLAKDEHELHTASDDLARIAADAAATGLEGVQLHAPALAAFGGFEVPVVSVVHSCVATWWAAVRGGALPSDLAWRAELTARGLTQSDAVVAPSAAFAFAVQNAYGLAEPPIAVHNGHSSVQSPAREISDLVLTAGRLWDEGKGAATFDAAAALSQTPFAAAGPLTGSNGTRVELHHARSLGQLSTVALANLLATRPLFVSAGRYEPFGLAVLEAAASGCALVLADIPTLRELWDGAATFVPVGDARALGQAADSLIADLDRRTRLGQAAFARAARYTPERTAAAMSALHASLTRDRHRHAA